MHRHRSIHIGCSMASSPRLILGKAMHLRAYRLGRRSIQGDNWRPPDRVWLVVWRDIIARPRASALPDGGLLLAARQLQGVESVGREGPYEFQNAGCRLWIVQGKKSCPCIPTPYIPIDTLQVSRKALLVK